MDRILDAAQSGPTFPAKPEIAAIVRDSIDRGVQLGHYELHAWGIMPNYVHLLITPLVGPAELLKSLKSATARKANTLLKRSGKPFWQDESFDRLVCDQDEFGRIKRYIEHNPVRTRLALTPNAYPWPSASPAEGPPQAESLPHMAQSRVEDQAYA